MNHLMPIALTCVGTAVFLWRLWSIRSRPQQPPSSSGVARTSIIVPARNEANNLPALLRSLEALQPKPLEVIVVDDHSDDGTGDIARKYGATVVVPQPIPPGWLGKSWACHTGMQQARGDYLLFTDADTVHAPDSLAFALETLNRTDAGQATYIPTHIIESFWERFQGVYHLLTLIATRAGSRTETRQSNRRFAIGQYLLFSRASYTAIGGHQTVAHRLSEDLALGAATAAAGLHTAVMVRKGALMVRMYPEGLRTFFAGWRRSFRDGIGTTGALGILEMFFVVTWLLGTVVWSCEALIGSSPTQALIWLGAYLGAAVLVAIKQRELGDFSAASALAYPVFVLLFIGVSIMVAIDAARGKPITWRGREIHLGNSKGHPDQISG